MSTKRERIVVSIYKDTDSELVANKTGIKVEDLSAKTIRDFFGLKPVARSTGVNTKIRTALKDNLKNMSEEQKTELLKSLETKKEGE